MKRVEKELRRIRSLIKKKNFHKAILSYTTLEKDVKALNEQDQKQLKKKTDLVYKELLCCLRINEAYLFAERGDVNKLKEEIQKIHDLAFDLGSEKSVKDVIVLLEYVDRHYKFFLDVYTYKTNVRLFNKLVIGVRKSFEEKNFKLGLKRFSELLVLYNRLAEIVDSEKRIELYYQIKILFKDLSLQRLFSFATERPEKISFDLDLPLVKPIFRKISFPESVKRNKHFDHLRELLVSEQEEKAIALYKHLTGLSVEKKIKGNISKTLKLPKVKPGFRKISFPQTGNVDEHLSRLRSLIEQNKVKHAEELYKSLKKA